MAPHSSTLAWKIPWTEEPGRLQSMGSLRVGHDWATSLSLFTFMHWRRKWQPTPVFLPGESQRQKSLVGCRLWMGSPSMESHRVGQDWNDLAAAAASLKWNNARHLALSLKGHKPYANFISSTIANLFRKKCCIYAMKFIIQNMPTIDCNKLTSIIWEI